MTHQTFEFSVEYYQFLNEQGELSDNLPEDYIDAHMDTGKALEAYKAMVLGRAFDAKAIALQRTGKMGTYPSILGQEAIGAAIGLAMAPEDIFAPYYRDMITQYLRGVKLEEMLLYWGGSEQGSAYQNCPHDFPNCVPIATQFCHAAGAAISLKVKGVHQASLVTCGEGATSKGDFLETLNLAGAWQLPLVMVVNNNQWAISTPRSTQTHAETIAQKAVGAGLPGVQVDGNDFFALTYALAAALKRAYAGKGATLIEAVTYRLGDHTTADDATRYRKDSELEKAWQAEPINRLKTYLLSAGQWDENSDKHYAEEVDAIVNQAVKAYLAAPASSPESMFDHLYESLPKPLEDQYIQSKYLSVGGF